MTKKKGIYFISYVKYYKSTVIQTYKKRAAESTQNNSRVISDLDSIVH